MPGHGARRRARSHGGRPSQGSGAAGGQRTARRAGQCGAATRRRTGRHWWAALYSHGSRSARASLEGRAHRGAAQAAAASPRRSRSAAPRGEGPIRCPQQSPEPQKSGGQQVEAPQLSPRAAPPRSRPGQSRTGRRKPKADHSDPPEPAYSFLPASLPATPHRSRMLRSSPRRALPQRPGGVSSALPTGGAPPAAGTSPAGRRREKGSRAGHGAPRLTLHPPAPPHLYRAERRPLVSASGWAGANRDPSPRCYHRRRCRLRPAPRHRRPPHAAAARGAPWLRRAAPLIGPSGADLTGHRSAHRPRPARAGAPGPPRRSPESGQRARCGRRAAARRRGAGCPQRPGGVCLGAARSRGV